ncbi:hypothetical protein CQ10_14280 [Bradyrhizobium valentinum]|nr:hypothetical protein CQ10_14280 [Bradyrhizobium valentinum]
MLGGLDINILLHNDQSVRLRVTAKQLLLGRNRKTFLVLFFRRDARVGNRFRRVANGSDPASCLLLHEAYPTPAFGGRRISLPTPDSGRNEIL